MRAKVGIGRHPLLAVLVALVLIAVVVIWILVSRDRPVRVVLAIDTSSSMNDPFMAGDTRTRIKVAKEWGQDGLNRLADNDEVGLWSFASPIPKLYVRRPLKRLGDYRDRRGLLRTAKLVPAGGTPLYDVIIDGVDELRAEWKDGATNALVILTDGGQRTRRPRPGDPYVYKTLDDVEDLAARINAGEPKESVPVLITAAADVGCGNTKPTDLRRIAHLFGGECYPAATTYGLQEALRRIIEVLRKGEVPTS